MSKTMVQERAIEKARRPLPARHPGRPTVLVFNKFYLPGFKAGGPIRTLANLVARLGEDFDFRIVALDRDSGDAAPYARIEQGRWNTVGQAQVRYLRQDETGFATLLALLRELAPDVIYLNSFFDATFSRKIMLARRLGLLGGCRVVLAPRGEFSAAALALKPRRKRCYLTLSRWFGLYRDVTWQASSAVEAESIRSCVPGAEPAVQVAPNLAPAEAEPPPTAAREEGAALRVCFLGRISPMKNLDYALRVLARVQAPVEFSIYGPVSDALYARSCRELAASLPAHVQVRWEGEVQPDTVATQLSRHDLFLFPTRGENYGHVIREALAAGLPVLLSDQTPWHDVMEQGLGWCLPLQEEAAFAAVVEEVAAWPAARRQTVSAAARRFATARANDAAVLEANRRLFSVAANALGWTSG